MAEYKIRGYRDSDYEVVRELFSHGMSEYVPSVCIHVLKQPWVLFVLTCTFIILLCSSKSLILPFMAVTLLLALGRQVLGYCWSMYIDHCLKEDLQDIRKTYMESRGSHFWVAEAEDSIVGTVAVKPSEENGEELILKRMSVRKDFRGLGIAKALSREVIGFARQGGYKAVLLNTLMVQVEAKKMYESVGFTKYLEYVMPTVYGNLINFTISKYRYDLFPAPS
ncbi:PREDICTED: probable N-acetyltransferase camello [Nanorana parkeri]|uniref:probable N-acetyltransferase camello n=1 Tax=Nanorana parkeri TaxID=125878 RepID=UPI000854A995|nr:PREDICTED: probable N-acetyltransferase camello [Nanorana parkeri]XP_018424019.1 PREDICTED: probable N-acetyltransferase camello [Nanorana parkeri]